MTTNNSEVSVGKLSKTSVKRILEDYRIKGIKIDRDRPAGSGWCGDETCKHASHQRFNSPAKKVKNEGN